MKSRQEIKHLGREAFLARYWPCVGTVVVLNAILAVLARLSWGVASLLLTGPFIIGLNFFFINIFTGNCGVNVGTMFTKAFDHNFGRKLGGYLWMQLFIFLWSLLLVVPGIIKTFSYAMTPYILSDCPNVRAQDALKLSKRMMRGHKWELFVFYLSYIGWYLLCLLPGVGLALCFDLRELVYAANCHYLSYWLWASYLNQIGLLALSILSGQLLNIFYVGPWISTARAGWYLELREECLRSGVITPDELNGGPLME